MTNKRPIVRYVGRVSYTDLLTSGRPTMLRELVDDKHGILMMEAGFIDGEEWDRTGAKPDADQNAAASLSGAYESSGEASLLVDRELASLRRYPTLYADVQGWTAPVDIRRNLESNRNYHLKLVRELNAQLGEE